MILFTRTRRSLVALFLAVAAATVAAAQAKPEINTSRDNLALQGHDPVAYFTQGRPVRGSAQYEFRWKGAVWRFASAEHRAEFAGDPARYAPQFGGYCAWAVSRGYTADGDPEAWKIVNGRLYLNYSKRVQRQWEEDIPGNIAAAEANWPKALAK